MRAAKYDVFLSIVPMISSTESKSYRAHSLDPCVLFLPERMFLIYVKQFVAVRSSDRLRWSPHTSRLLNLTHPFSCSYKFNSGTWVLAGLLLIHDIIRLFTSPTKINAIQLYPILIFFCSGLYDFLILRVVCGPHHLSKLLFFQPVVIPLFLVLHELAWHRRISGTYKYCLDDKRPMMGSLR